MSKSRSIKVAAVVGFCAAVAGDMTPASAYDQTGQVRAGSARLSDGRVRATLYIGLIDTSLVTRLVWPDTSNRHVAVLGWECNRIAAQRKQAEFYTGSTLSAQCPDGLYIQYGEAILADIP